MLQLDAASTNRFCIYTGNWTDDLAVKLSLVDVAVDTVGEETTRVAVGI